MQYRNLGRSGVKVSPLCVGTMTFGGATDEATAQRIGAKARIVVVNDALVALTAGAGDDPGIVIIAGTGSIAYGRNAGGEAARASGWGMVSPACSYAQLKAA